MSTPEFDTDALCRVLEDEARVAEALGETLRRERQAIVDLEADAVLASVAARRTQHEELERLAGHRSTLLGELPGDAPTVTALLPHLAPSPRDRVRVGVRRLRRALLAVRSLERQNQILAGASLETTGELLHALRGMLPGTRYGADARLAAPAPVESLDRRA